MINEYQQKKIRFSTINTKTKANRKLEETETIKLQNKKKKEGISKNRKEVIKNIIAEVKAFIILLE